tara:strand:- start:47 stop:622 length:576 start_codon:yes stop_codon:yes gene_type:complete
MRRKIVLLTVALLILLAPNTNAASETGVDNNPGDDVPFTVIERDSPSVDKEKWSLTIEMSQEAYDNGTTFEITTQICTNDGVCDPPETMDADIDERIHSISVTPPTDHTYINWRVKAIDSEGNKTNYPHGDWFKTWSSCYYDDGIWGGEDSIATGGCIKSGEDTPGFSTIFTIAAILIALATVAKRKTHQK